MTHAAPVSLLRLPEVKRRTGLSKTEIYRRMAANLFPRQRKISPRVAAWPDNLIDAWVAAAGLGHQNLGEDDLDLIG
jgi:prophage regulatory protein